MKRFLVGSLFLIVLPISGVASENSEFYDSIRTLETLTVVLDGRASEHQFTDQGMEFTHYYSSKLNRSFIVNDEIGEVCSSYEGSEVLSCFPCEAGEVSEVCP